jgi:glutathione synthase
MDILWITNPLDSLELHADTSCRLLLESGRRGNHNYQCCPHEVTWTSNGGASISCRRVNGIEQAGLTLISKQEIKVSHSFDLIMLRVDPPISEQYRAAISSIASSLDRAGLNSEHLIVNSPTAILGLSGRLLTLLSQDIPRTIVSSDVNFLFEFIVNEKVSVLKSIQGHGGAGVMLANTGGMTPRSLRDFIRDYLTSEKRVWFAAGRVVGVCKKRLDSHMFPPAFAKHGCVLWTDLTEAEKVVCKRLGRVLADLNICLAGVDLISGRVTDINVVSPGLLVEMETVGGSNLACEVMKTLEERTDRTQR